MQGRHHYTMKNGNAVAARIKWCREQFGQRGVRWDFSGGFNITISIVTDDDALFYDKTWRFWNVLKGDDQKEVYRNV